MVNPQKIFGRLGNSMFQGAYLYSQAKKGYIRDIFAQDYTQFDEYKDEIKKLYGEGIGYLPYVGLHLRVGGNPINPEELAYMDNPFYTSLVRTGYYIKALEMFPENEGFKILVFSDDMDYAKGYFTGGRFGFDDATDPIESFNRLASCHHKIITNSSYSWWAGYLSNMKDAKVIAPTESSWFSDKVERVKLPPEWTQIDP